MPDRDNTAQLLVEGENAQVLDANSDIAKTFVRWLNRLFNE